MNGIIGNPSGLKTVFCAAVITESMAQMCIKPKQVKVDTEPTGIGPTACVGNAGECGFHLLAMIISDNLSRWCNHCEPLHSRPNQHICSLQRG